jgi:hypothetical protein
MKKILFTALLTASMHLVGMAQADSKKSELPQKPTAVAIKSVDDAEQDAKLAVKELANLIPLNDTIVQSLFQLLTMKYTVTYDSEMSGERKSIMKSDVAAKLRATLTEAQMKLLEKNTELLNKLIN